ncbi:MAG: HDOD domain-containing protein [Fimbriimonadaceae bacterium]
MAAQQQMDRATAVAEIMKNGKDLAALPQVVFKVMEVTGSDTASAAELEKIIVVDPGFSVKLLSIANSAQFALPRQVSSIREAVMYIGVRQVRQTAMAVGVFDMFIGKNDTESKRRRVWWRHSVDTAMAAKALSEEFGWFDPNIAYTAGLLHWCGKTVLDKANPGNYEKVLMVVDRGATVWQAESAVFGCDHRDIAISSAQAWGFSDELTEGLQYYVRPGEPAPASKLAAVIAVSAGLAHVALNGRSGNSAKPWGMWASTALGIPDEIAENIIERGLAAITAGSHLHF